MLDLKDVVKDGREMELLIRIPTAINVINRSLEIWQNKASKKLLSSLSKNGTRCFEILNGTKTECPDCIVKTVFMTGVPASKQRHYMKMTLQIDIEPVFDEMGLVVAVVEAIRDITSEIRKQERIDEAIKELNETMEELKTTARTDNLTKIFNNRGICEHIEQEFGRAKRSKQKFSLAMFDIDHFKSINDKYGHIAGDQALYEIAALISKRIREIDKFGRYGGEEFILLMPETDTNGALILCEDIRNQIAMTKFTGYSLDVTISGGIATFDGNNEHNLDETLGKIDAALYESKQNGRNKITQV